MPVKFQNFLETQISANILNILENYQRLRLVGYGGRRNHILEDSKTAGLDF
jgi:hypothetical protein